MSFKAELTIEGKTYNVRRFFVSVKRSIDQRGRPSSMPSWSLFVVIDAVEDTTLTSWMVDSVKYLDGELIIYKIDQNSKLKEISFMKSYCYGMNDLFNSETGYATCELLIAGRDLNINTSGLKQNWPGEG